MTRVVVGIAVRERVDLTLASLASLRAFTDEPAVVVLADGPDAATRDGLLTAGVSQLGWDGSRGDAHCFNRLVTERAADVYVLLENGARVSPGWLDALLQGLQADPANGLCGPSTNRAWNEQQQFADAGGEHHELSITAASARAQFGVEQASLAPLHSLGDFCYVVRRAVVDVVGAADEGYAEGPCWEMDYNARAARAGFRGVWVKAAYVWRAPATSRRQSWEARRMAFSKRRYQQQLCGLHLRGQTRGFDAHCTGEACEHFAPADLIKIRREFTFGPKTALAVGPARRAERAERSFSERPLVSCIMPTANRRAFVPQAIEMFLAQDYPERELLILDDGDDSVEDLIPSDERIRYVRRPRGQSLGRKRNEAVQLSRGDVIVHWDDDDWHASFRLSYQVERLLATGADLCGLDRIWFYDPAERRAWQYRYPGGRARWLSGNSFCYRRKLWDRLRFGDTNVGEDTRFVREATFAKLLPLERDDFFVARVHAGNTCRKQTQSSSYVPAPSEEVEAIIARGRAQRALPAALGSQPLVSCIMPTFERPAFVALALRRFAEQTYPNKELVVVDDGVRGVENLVAGVPGVNYLRMRRSSIGEKRNAACAAARGAVIVHWDDDDWYGPARLGHQLEPILSGRADVTGLRCGWLMTLPDGKFWRVSPELHRRMFVADVHGGTLMFRRDVWERGARYPSTNLAEDADMLRAALKRGARLEVLEGDEHFVYSRHAINAWRFTTGSFIDPQQWQRATPPPALQDVADAYCDAQRRLGSEPAPPRDEGQRALASAPPTVEDHVNPAPASQIELQQTFTHIYAEDVWGSGSGPGSTLEYTRSYRAFLEQFLVEHAVRSVVDAGCGDWSFSRAIDWKGARYVGIDVVPSLIDENLRRFPGFAFERGDARDLSAHAGADLLLVKDTLQHWSRASLQAFLGQPALSSFKHVLVTNCEHSGAVNADIPDGGFRPLNFGAPDLSDFNGRVVLRFGTKAVAHRGPRLTTPELFERFEWWMINLDRRSDRFEHARRQLASVGVANVRRFRAFDGQRLQLTGRSPDWVSKGAVGCYLSHVALLKQAQARRQPCIIVEDDLVFADDFPRRFASFFAEVPEDWDVLLLSGGQECRPPQIVSAHCARLVATWGTSLSVLRLPAIDRLLEQADELDRPIDDFYIQAMPTLKFYAPRERLIDQEFGLGSNVGEKS